MPHFNPEITCLLQVHGGVRCIRLRGDPGGKTTGRRVVTGGADGYVMQWELTEVTGTRKDGSAIKGVDLRCLSTADEHAGPNRFRLDSPAAPYDPKNPPMVVSLDCHMAKPTEFVAGTGHCDIWEVDKDPQVRTCMRRFLFQGQEAGGREDQGTTQ